MSNQTQKNRSHFIFSQNAQAQDYKVPPRGRGNSVIIHKMNRTIHGQTLRNQLQQIAPLFVNAVKQQQQMGVDIDLGLQIEFESFSDIDLAVESLESEKSGIELRNVRKDGDKTFATVFVPDGKLSFFEKRITEYLDSKKDVKRSVNQSDFGFGILHRNFFGVLSCSVCLYDIYGSNKLYYYSYLIQNIG